MTMRPRAPDPAPGRAASFGVPEWLLGLLPVALAAWVYYPITRAYFWGDDFIHLTRIASGHSWTFVLSPFGGHNLQLRNLAYVVSWWLFGLDPGPWFWTVLATHLFNVWLFFGLIAALTGSLPLATFGATLWGTCPLATGTLAFYCVYGQVMGTTVILLVLRRVARLAERGAAPTRWDAACWYTLLLAGTTCFATNAGAALVFPFVLFLISPAAWRVRSIRYAFVLLPAVTLALYFGLRQLAQAIEPLSMAELLQIPLARSGGTIAPIMLAHLAGVGISGSVLGYLSHPEQYPHLRDVGAILAFGIGLVVVLARGTPHVRRAALAMIVLACGVYGVIAVGRAALYAGFLASLARAAAELRYHYLGTVPLVGLLCMICGEVGRIGPLAAVPGRLTLLAGVVAPIAVWTRAPTWIDPHAATREYVARSMVEIGAAAATAPPGTVYVENGRTPASTGPFLDRFFPGRAAVFVLHSPSSDVLNGRVVRFIERDPEVLAYWAERPNEPTARLLVPPDHVPPQS